MLQEVAGTNDKGVLLSKYSVSIDLRKRRIFVYIEGPLKVSYQ